MCQCFHIHKTQPSGIIVWNITPSYDQNFCIPISIQKKTYTSVKCTFKRGKNWKDIAVNCWYPLKRGTNRSRESEGKDQSAKWQTLTYINPINMCARICGCVGVGV